MLRLSHKEVNKYDSVTQLINSKAIKNERHGYCLHLKGEETEVQKHLLGKFSQQGGIRS